MWPLYLLLLTINLSIGEPKHATPAIIKDALVANLDGLATYPTTLGVPALRQAIANWATRRYGIPQLNIDTEILPVIGSREALFAIAQVVIDHKKANPIVISPNPFYQIYEGAAFLAGATPYFLNTMVENNHAMDFSSVPAEILNRTQLLYICSPGNPSGKIMTLTQWQEIFALSDQYNFVTVDLFEGKNLTQVAQNIITLKRELGYGFNKKAPEQVVAGYSSDNSVSSDVFAPVSEDPTRFQDGTRTGEALRAGQGQVNEERLAKDCAACGRLITAGFVNACNTSWPRQRPDMAGSEVAEDIRP